MLKTTERSETRNNSISEWAIISSKYAAYLVVAILWGIASAGSINPSTREDDLARQHVSRTFPEATRIESVELQISQEEADSVFTLSKQHWRGDSLILLIPIADSTVLGFAVIDNVRGRDQLITYLIAVTPRLVIKNVEILAYRESYGGEVRNSSWLGQFIDKRPGDELRPGREIRTITGATISSRAVTHAVKRMLCLLQVIHAKLPRTNGVHR